MLARAHTRTRHAQAEKEWEETQNCFGSGRFGSLRHRFNGSVYRDPEIVRPNESDHVNSSICLQPVAETLVDSQKCTGIHMLISDSIHMLINGIHMLINDIYGIHMLINDSQIRARIRKSKSKSKSNTARARA